MPGTISENLSRIYQPPEWFDHEAAAEAVGSMPDLVRPGIYSVAGTLAVVEKLGLMPAAAGDVYEFGSGMGEGLVTLNMFARAAGDTSVRGSEHSSRAYHYAKQVAQTLLPNVASIDIDGLSGLKNRPKSFSLVVAHMFGPSYYNEELPSRFVPAALGALCEGGVIIINSDAHTMFQVSKWTEKNLPAGSFDEINEHKLPRVFGKAQPFVVIRK
jgi:hypothetical protein